MALKGYDCATELRCATENETQTKTAGECVLNVDNFEVEGHLDAKERLTHAWYKHNPNWRNRAYGHQQNSDLFSCLRLPLWPSNALLDIDVALRQNMSAVPYSSLFVLTLDPFGTMCFLPEVTPRGPVSSCILQPAKNKYSRAKKLTEKDKIRFRHGDAPHPATCSVLNHK